MSRAKSSLAALALAIAFTPACATKPDPEAAANAELQKAMELATQPATPEEVDAANRADPLTRANFWSKEYNKDPSNLDNTLSFADSLRDIGSDERAIEILSEVMVVHPNEPRLLMALGRALGARDNYLGAARAFEKASLIEPGRAEAWAALGTALDRLGNPDKAQAAYAKALSIEPDRASTLANYGLSLAINGNLPGAEEKLRKAAQSPDADVRVKENLALVLGLQGKFDEMTEVSRSYAPQDIVERNVELLRGMVQPSRTWDALAANAVTGAPSPTPARAVEGGATTPEAGSGLRLRQSGN